MVAVKFVERLSWPERGEAVRLNTSIEASAATDVSMTGPRRKLSQDASIPAPPARATSARIRNKSKDLK